MVANFAAGGAAINQLARTAGASLRVIPLSLEQPTADFTTQPAMDEAAFLAAVATGYDAVSPEADLVCLGEMGIGNTTAAAAMAAALFGGGGARWAGRGTGVDERGLTRKQAVIDQALARHAAALARSAARSPRRSADASLPRFSVRRSRRGNERIPVLLDGFVCTAAAAPLAKLRADALDSRDGGPCLGRSGASDAARRAWAGAAARSRHAAGREPRVRRSRCWCCARRSPATPGWQPSPRPGVSDRPVEDVPLATKVATKPSP